MSGPPPDRPFSETEKVVLLAEILKWSDIPSNTLVEIIRHHQVEPAWPEITRPSGRGLPSCQRALREMLNIAPAPAPVQYYDPSAFPPQQQQQQQQQQQRHYVEPINTVPGRSIVPRPQGMQHGAYAPSSTSPYSQSPSTAEPPRKRGRPSNADLERRRQAAEARGETYVPPPSRPRKQKARVSATPSEIAAGAMGGTPRRESNTDPIATPPSGPGPVPLTRATTSPALSQISQSSKRVRSPDVDMQQERRSTRRDGDDVPRSMDASRGRGPHWPSAAHPSPWSQAPHRPAESSSNTYPHMQQPPLASDSSSTGTAPIPQQPRAEHTRSPLRDGDRWRK